MLQETFYNFFLKYGLRIISYWNFFFFEELYYYIWDYISDKTHAQLITCELQVGVRILPSEGSGAQTQTRASGTSLGMGVGHWQQWGCE